MLYLQRFIFSAFRSRILQPNREEEMLENIWHNRRVAAQLIKANEIYFHHDKNKLLEGFVFSKMPVWMAANHSKRCIRSEGSPLLYWRMYAELFVVWPFVFVCLLFWFLFGDVYLIFFVVVACRLSRSHLQSHLSRSFCPYALNYFCAHRHYYHTHRGRKKERGQEAGSKGWRWE